MPPSAPSNFHPPPSAIWLLADLRVSLPQADGHVARLQQLLSVLQELVSFQELLALERALEAVDACVSSTSLDAPSAAPRGWRFWRRGTDSLFLSTLVMSEDLQRTFRGLVSAAQAYQGWTEACRQRHSRAFLDFCIEAKGLQRFLPPALEALALAYSDLQGKLERARSNAARAALRTLHDKARLVADVLRQYDMLVSRATQVQEGISELAAARERMLACLGPDLASHAQRLRHYLDEVGPHENAATRADKLQRARTARTHLQAWLEQAGAAMMQMHTAQQQLADHLRHIEQCFPPLHAARRVLQESGPSTSL